MKDEGTDYHFCIFQLLPFIVQLWGQVINPQDIISTIGQDAGTIGGPRSKQELESWADLHFPSIRTRAKPISGVAKPPKTLKGVEDTILGETEVQPRRDSYSYSHIIAVF